MFPVYFPGPGIIFPILNSASIFLYSVIFNCLLSRQEAYSAAKEIPLILIVPDLITWTLMLGFKQRSPTFLILVFLYAFKKNPMWRPCPSLCSRKYTFSQIDMKLDTEAL